jgi:hypothetical protein
MIAKLYEFKKEIETYRNNLPTLLKDEGKYILISGILLLILIRVIKMP